MATRKTLQRTYVATHKQRLREIGAPMKVDIAAAALDQVIELIAHKRSSDAAAQTMTHQIVERLANSGFSREEAKNRLSTLIEKRRDEIYQVTGRNIQ